MQFQTNQGGSMDEGGFSDNMPLKRVDPSGSASDITTSENSDIRKAKKVARLDDEVVDLKESIRIMRENSDELLKLVKTAKIRRRPRPVVDLEDDYRKMAEFVLRNYYDTKGVDYEFVRFASHLTFIPSRQGLDVHFNIWGRRKDSPDSSLLELFFVSLKKGDPIQVHECTLLEDMSHVPSDTSSYVVFHPGDVKCGFCDRAAERHRRGPPFFFPAPILK